MYIFVCDKYIWYLDMVGFIFEINFIEIKAKHCHFTKIK